MTNLKSCCTSATNAPYTIPTTASTAIVIRQVWSPMGKSVMATRNAPYAPNFMTTPASSMEAAVGAATWPVGAQVWKGQRPARMAKPTKTTMKAQFWKAGGNGYFANSTKSNVLPPATTYAAISPTRTMALPTNE